MHDDDYPDWICSECALNAGGYSPAIATFHMEICNVCNEFTSVSEPRDFGYPKVRSNFNKDKVLTALEKAKNIYISEGNIIASYEIDRRIIHYKFCM